MDLLASKLKKGNKKIQNMEIIVNETKKEMQRKEQSAEKRMIAMSREISNKEKEYKLQKEELSSVIEHLNLNVLNLENKVSSLDFALDKKKKKEKERKGKGRK